MAHQVTDREGNKTKAPKLVTPKPSKEAKQTIVPGMKTTEMAQRSFPPQAAPANHGLTVCPGAWDLFWIVQGKNCAKLMGLLKEI